MTTELSKAFYSIPEEERTPVADEICKAMEWSRSTFDNKKAGRSSITYLERAALTFFFKSKGVDYISGLPIFYR
jgi:hypothetical protein